MESAKLVEQNKDEKHKSKKTAEAKQEVPAAEPSGTQFSIEAWNFPTLGQASSAERAFKPPPPRAEARLSNLKADAPMQVPMPPPLPKEGSPAEVPKEVVPKKAPPAIHAPTPSPAKKPNIAPLEDVPQAKEPTPKEAPPPPQFS
eukprot:5178629-Pyramimonas_sp.AAC.1